MLTWAGMDDLVAFVRARLDENEAAAKAATPGPWHALTTAEVRRVGAKGEDQPEETWAAAVGGRPVMSADESRHDADCVHIALHDPARALREVEAGRRRLERYLNASGRDLPEGVHEGRDPDERERDQAVKDALEDEVREDAAVWSDHPDYPAAKTSMHSS